MAKQKRGRPQPATAKTAVSSGVGYTGAGSSLFLPGDRLTLKGYVLMNVIFDAFCILQLLFIRFTLNETRGLYFFFGLLMFGFLVVSIYDYVYDRLVPSAAEAE